MKIEIEFEPDPNAPLNWRWYILRRLKEVLDSFDFIDYRVTLCGTDPCLIPWIEETEGEVKEKPQETRRKSPVERFDEMVDWDWLKKKKAASNVS